MKRLAFASLAIVFTMGTAQAVTHLPLPRVHFMAPKIVSDLPPKLASLKASRISTFKVVPENSDIFGTGTTTTVWVPHFGCPTNIITEVGYTPSTVKAVPFTDPACLTGDPLDPSSPQDYPNINHGLILNKMGPTANYAAAQVQLKGGGIHGGSIKELGFDIRSGSHCGPAPYFYVIDTKSNVYYYGCNAMVATATSTGWKRLRVPTPIMPVYTVCQIYILMDEGQDTASSDDPMNYSGLAVLDNIDVNGTLVGHP